MKLKSLEPEEIFRHRDWQDYLLQMLQIGYFEIAYNENNHLKVTEIGNDVLFGRRKAKLVIIKRDENENRKGRKMKIVTNQELSLEVSPTENKDLFEALRRVRKQLADQEAIPAYIVLSDKYCTCSVFPDP